ncbi:MAG: tetratricopeptide repeat protein [Gammaproteobacteria bacterium]|nr:tetratricopeptide repeat protein [Gammaproteobacteria bacterium]
MLKVNFTILQALWLPVVLVTGFTLTGCTSVYTGDTEAERLADPNQSLVVRETPASVYSVHSDLMYEILLGELSGQFDDIEQALEHYVRAARLSDDPEIAERATRIAMVAKNWTAGLEAASRWSELVGDSLKISQILGVLELRSGNVDRAAVHFEKIMLAAEDSPAKGYSIIGAVLTREPDTEQAILLLEKLVNKYFENPYGHLTLASLAFQAGDYPRAAHESELALKFKPDLVEAHVMRAQALMELEETDQALQEMKRIVEEVPENREIRMSYARMLLAAQRYEEAESEFEVLHAENPNDSDLIHTLGLLQFQLQRYEAAKASFSRLVDRNQRKDEAHYYLGRVAEDQADFQTAISEYEKVEKRQYYLDAKARIASIYVELDGLEKAQQYLEELRGDLSSPEDIVEVYLIEGQLLYSQKLYVVAMDLYSKGLQEFPGHSDLLYARALMAEEIDRIDLLESDLMAILSEDPDNALALNALGYTLADHNFRIDEALEYIKRALEIRPDDPAVIDSMGWVQFRLGNYEQAEQYLRKAYRLLEDAEIGGHLVELFWAQGDYQGAQKMMQEVLERFPDEEYLLELQRKFQQ